MGNYIQENLIKGEKVLYEAKISFWAQFWLILMGFVFLCVWWIGISLWILAYLRYKTTELAITNKRVIAKFGIIRRSTVEMNLAKVESIQVHQGIVARVLNFGTLVVSGAGNPLALIPGIDNPLGFRRKIMEAQERRGR